MNKDRRTRLRAARKQLSDARDDIKIVNDEEDDARDTMPESLQGTERYESSEEASEHLEDAMDFIDKAIKLIQEAEDT